MNRACPRSDVTVRAGSSLRVVLVKPSKYATGGSVERFRRGFMPNSTLPHMASLTPPRSPAAAVELHAVDEYVETDLEYLRLLEARPAKDDVCWPSSASRATSFTAPSTSPPTRAPTGSSTSSSAGRIR